jgi:YVTN family beta-propeller protein
MKHLLLLGSAAACAACSAPSMVGPPLAATSSSTIAVSSDDKSLWVVNPDADSVSLIDVSSRSLAQEVALGAGPPSVDPMTKRYEPAVKPRALAILPGDAKVYVAGQTANRIYIVDAQTRAVRGSIAVPAAPTGVVAAPDGSAVYVVSHEAAMVTRIDPASDAIVASLPVAEHPWGASVSSDGRRLYVTHLLLQAGVTVIDTSSFSVAAQLGLADQPPDAAGKLVPNGQPRGVYVAVPRPAAGELWLPHLLLATGTAQPDLDFESTVFPTITLAAADGSAALRRLLFKPLLVPGAQGSFTDSVSGPRALAFTPDGKLALLALSQSEDVMVFDGASGNEVALVRPIPGAFLEGIAVDHAGRRAFVDGRNSHDVTVLSIDPSNTSAPVSVDGAPIDRLAADPMPADLRLGQRLFYTANSGVYPVTKNFWVACSSCHLEGATDAVTWRFVDGPRDTPSNAGGPINTGFLFRLALRNDVVQYDKTIRVEQGGAFDRGNASQLPLLQALADFVNYAIPYPQNPNRAADGTLTDAQQRGQATFQAQCASCHTGPFLTDSGAGNPTLDENGAILLHDVGTCVTSGPFVDKPAAEEVTGQMLMHAACDFDTPTLRGVFASAPYFHDGSAATLAEVVDRLPFSAQLPPSDKSDLVEYLKTL